MFRPRGGDVIKPRHPLEPATSRKSPLLSCSTPIQSLFLRGLFFVCLRTGRTPYTQCCRWMCFPCSVFYLARDLNLGIIGILLCGACGTGGGAIDPHYPTGLNMSYKTVIKCN